jgi:hypothetical protein
VTIAELHKIENRRHGHPRPAGSPRRRWLCRRSAAERIWGALEAHAGEWWTLDALAVVLPDIAAPVLNRAAWRLVARGLIARELVDGLAVFAVPFRDLGHDRRALWEAGLQLCPAPACPAAFPTETGLRVHVSRWCRHGQ